MAISTTNRVSDLVDKELLDFDPKQKLSGVQDLILYREQLEAKLEAVDDALVETAQLIQKAVVGSEPEVERQSKGSGRVQRVNTTRNGRQTDTSKIIDILKAHDGEMSTSDLKAAAEKKGIKNPESALYSLRNTGMIVREKSTITFVGEEEG